MENNKLIAEFMGLETPDRCYFEHLTKDGNRKLTHHILLEYHTSLDWLMPVVVECLTKGDDTHAWDDIYNAVSTLDIKEVHEVVVEFIKEYKNNNNA